MNPTEKLKQAFAEWEEKVLKPVLKRFPERKERFTTSSGIPVPRFLLPPDPDPDYLEKLGFPGATPFTRGVQPTMYRGRFWTMRRGLRARLFIRVRTAWGAWRRTSMSGW